MTIKLKMSSNTATMDASSNIREIFSRENVEKNDNVKLFDHDEETGLDLFSYMTCDNNDSYFHQQCRGLVYDKENLVLKGFSYATEYTDTESMKQLICDENNRILNNWKFYLAFEGSLLRLFYFQDRWFLSTHRKLNAFKSKWSCQDSFGTIFKLALEHEFIVNSHFRERLQNNNENIYENFLTTLDRNKQYMFLVLNNEENRIVCRSPSESESYVYHVGTFENLQLIDFSCDVSRPVPLTFESFDDFTNYLDSIDIFYNSGLIAFSPEGRQYKFLRKDYLDCFQVRGNEPSLRFRYLQVRLNPELVRKLYLLYPRFIRDFDYYESLLYDIAKMIHKTYIQRFIKKLYVTLPTEEYSVMKDCHQWYLTDRENNKVTLEKVIKFLNKKSPTLLNHMIRRAKLNKMNGNLVQPRFINSPAIHSNTNYSDFNSIQL